jgi:Zn-dependent M28 family amino/carboxypeptidase
MKRASIAVAIAVTAALVLSPVASAVDRVNTQRLRNLVTVDGILEHERALQRIAIANGGNRAATTPGYDASVTYVVDRLRDAGYNVTIDEFDFPLWTLNGPSTLAEVSPTARTFTEDTDYIVAQFSSSADLTAHIVPTNDIQIPPGGAGTGTSGCEASDFPPETAGNIALMQRGTCTFTSKYAAAKAAGAVGALIFNDGVGADREAPIPTTATANIGIPTAMISNDVGEALYNEAQAGAVSVRIVVDATTTPNTEMNVLADSRRGNPNRTIVMGGHLDSVEAGPGINDNGSGTSTLLEIAEQVPKLARDPRNRLRFAFWGAEEAGLVGSTAYVDELVANGDLSQVEANLNFDMLGSVNFVRFVYDGDTSSFPPPMGGAPPGSAQIEHVFQRYFDSQGLVSDPTAFDGRSDYGPFIANGVAAGGLFSGAEGIKTPRQESIYGGFAGLPFDPCYHVPPTNGACDDFFNLSNRSLDQMSDAAAHTGWTLARSRSAITQEPTATASRAKKANRTKRGKPWKYRGPFRLR